MANITAGTSPDRTTGNSGRESHSGGMVCTDNEDIYQMLRMFRSHGMVREATDEKLRSKYALTYPSLNPDCIFAYQPSM